MLVTDTDVGLKRHLDEDAKGVVHLHREYSESHGHQIWVVKEDDPVCKTDQCPPYEL